MTSGTLECRRELVGIFQAAIAAVEPSRLVRDHLSADGEWVLVHDAGREYARWRGPTFMVGAGKAAARMAAGCEAELPHGQASGLVITSDGYAVPLRDVDCVEAGHPVPDLRAWHATEALCVRLSASPRPVLAVLSGGASSLLVRPRPPLTLHDTIVVNQMLLASGADIRGVNCVRKHLSLVKGGGLLRLTSARPFAAFLLSDVVGDDPAVIGSGPTVPDPTTYAEAIEVLRCFELEEKVPLAVRELLARGQQGDVAETLKPGDAAAEGVFNLIVGSNRTALAAAASEASRLGYRVIISPQQLHGPTAQAAARWLEVVESAARHSSDGLCVLAGGETTVAIRGKGRGGRNQEFALTLVRGVAQRNLAVLSAGTDGIDGPTDAAGAFVDGSTLERAVRANRDPEKYLRENDSYAFFAGLGDLFRCGPTGTNVMDIKIALRPAL